MKRLAPALLIWLAAAASPPPAAAEVRTLVIVVDAVPFEVVDDLIASRAGDDPLYEGFQPPVPIISAFPSSTSVAMVGLLEPFDLPLSPGYEARFFDWERRRVRGGGGISFFRIEFAWRNFFDWSRKGVARSAVAALRPVKVSNARLDRAIDAFFRSEKDLFWVYVETTDLTAHLKGPHRLEEVFVQLDAELEEAREQHPEVDFRTVIFSDHGIAGDGPKLVNVLPAVKKALRRGGFDKSKRLRESDDLAVTPYGLVSSLEAYVDSERVPAASSALVEAEGVDLCAYRSDETFVVEDRDGRARIERRREAGGLSWRYIPESGDPLDYRVTVGGLSRRSGTGFVPDTRWLRATSHHRYPDALYRIARAFDLVENPASIVCSLDPGYMYGMVATERLANASGSTVRWTHGALGRDASLGFLLTDDERFSAGGAVRFDRALVPLTRPRPAAAAGGDDRPQDKMPGVDER